jgi:apoptosis-inducing factor 2
MHSIVIVGGNFAGVSAGHYILRHVVPRLNALSRDAYKVTIISPSDRTFYKISVPRALVKDDIIRADSVFQSIPDGFKEYKTSDFTFVHGTAVSLDESTKAISVQLTSIPDQTTTVSYDSLVIATGTTSNSQLWTLHGDWHSSKAALQEVNARLSTAKSILVAGGGAVGVETTGEFASSYHPKDLTLLSGDAQLLNQLKNKGVGKAAEKRLKEMGSEVVHNLRVTASAPATDDKTKTVVTLSDGTIRRVDLYIDCTGGRPNTAFLPRSWLDVNSRVVTDTVTLRATQAPKGVYAIGDVASYSKRNVLGANYAVPPLGYSIYADLSAAAVKKGGAKAMAAVAVVPLKEKKYKHIESDVMFVPIGPKGGVGVVFGWRIPSFLVWLVKSRTYFLEKSPGLANGEEFVKA